MNQRTLTSTLALAATLALPSIASAQTGFALNRFDPSERGSEWLALDSLDLRGNLRPAIGVVGDWAHKPLLIVDQNGNERSAIVRNQLFLHVGGAINVGGMLRLGVNLPVLAYNDGDGGSVNGVPVKAPGDGALGDLRLSADVRLVGQHRSPFQLAVGASAFLPTGSENAYAGDGKPRLAPRLIAAGDLGPFVYSAKLGFQWRDAKDPVGAANTGSEVTFGAAAGVRTASGKLVVGPELYGSTVVSESGAFFSKRATPVEAILGAHYTLGDDWRIGAGVGPGITRGYGSPQVRVLASIEWVPGFKEKPVPPSDRDRDGIIDTQDACVDEPGPKSEDPKTHGCPPPPDRDKDGVLDGVDACPDEAGVPSDSPKTNGCPPPQDRDKDGVVDAKDSCPDQPGVASDDPQKNGCPLPPPDPDRDKDSIVNEQDACPDEAGKADPDPKKNGCPSGAVVGDQIVMMEPVLFKTGSSVILPASDAVLQKVLATIKKLPDANRYRVEGHTDNRGNAAMNKTLSKARAASVVKWMTKNGIDANRLDAAGFGQDRPIASNDTDEGRQRNRRVEFHIAEAKSAADGGAPAKPAPATKSAPAPKK